jgi:AraC family transcriptional regulator of arabinose operon
VEDVIRGSRVSFGEVAYPPGGTFGPRLQRSVQLVLVHDGAPGVVGHGEELSVASGHAALLLPGHLEYFRFSPAVQTRHSWVHFWSAGADVALLRRLAAVRRVIPISPTLSRLVRSLLPEPDPTAPLTVLRAFEILYRYVDDARVEGRGRPPTVDAALTFVEEHLPDPLSVERLAGAANVSRPHLFRLFREHLGMTPADYVWQRRVEYALELLRETGLPIAAVAQRAGFRTPKHLSRRVRAATGETPTAVRAAALGGAP